MNREEQLVDSLRAARESLRPVRDERLVGVSLRAAREDHRHRERDVLPDGPLYAQAIAGVLLFCFRVVVFVLLLRLMDVIP